MNVYILIILFGIVNIIYGFNYIRRKIQPIKFNKNLFGKDQYLILNKMNEKISLSNDKSINNSKIKNILNNDLIILTPAGANGFYNLGICYYLKKNYDLNKYIYSGASAGAWNSLFIVFKKDLKELINIILCDEIKTKKNLQEVQLELKKQILNKYTENDFELNKIFISVSVVDNLHFNNYIYSDFTSLEDAIDCCIASSNIPILTGNFILFYHNYLSFDGGFKKNSYFTFKIPYFNIEKTIWGRKFEFLKPLSKINLNELIMDGFKDSEKNKDKLDKLFIASTNFNNAKNY
jgi:hypothetical protein